VPDFPTDDTVPLDDAVPLDGVVGSLADESAGTAPFSSPHDVPIRLAVSGDAVADAGAVLLAQDLTLLVQNFRSNPSTGADQEERAPSPAEHADVEIALHGLNLDADQEARLRQLIRRVVQERAPGGEATP
jgi:hypothetical protein